MPYFHYLNMFTYTKATFICFSFSSPAPSSSEGEEEDVDQDQISTEPFTDDDDEEEEMDWEEAPPPVLPPLNASTTSLRSLRGLFTGCHVHMCK